MNNQFTTNYTAPLYCLLSLQKLSIGVSKTNSQSRQNLLYYDSITINSSLTYKIRITLMQKLLDELYLTKLMCTYNILTKSTMLLLFYFIFASTPHSP